MDSGFIPVERLWPNRVEQELFREEWQENLFYYFVSSLMVQVLTFMTFAPAKALLYFAPLAGIRAWIAALRPET